MELKAEGTAGARHCSTPEAYPMQSLLLRGLARAVPGALTASGVPESGAPPLAARSDKNKEKWYTESKNGDSQMLITESYEKKHSWNHILL
jgi:hypothetical protein